MHRHRLALPGVLCVFVLAAMPLRAQEVCADAFWAAQSLEAYDSPREAVIADFDGDGRADVAVTVYHGNLLQVFRQQAGGGYSPTTYGVSQGVGYQTDDLTVGDVDGDGDVDLVMVNSFDRTFTVFKNDGAGAFAWSQTINQQFSFGDVQLGDLDRDGDLDLVTSGSGSAVRELSVYLNTAGSFAWSRDYAVAGFPGSIVVAQLDADTAPDVAVAAGDDGSVSVLWNSGNGVLQAPVRIATAASPGALAAADVNGDGRLDLLTGHAANQVSLLANAGGRVFAPLASIATGVRSSQIALADVDLDGDLDLAVTGTESLSVPAEGLSVLRNDGAGAFAPFERVGNADGPGPIAAGDLDGDGDPDLAVPANNGVRLFTNGAGRLRAAPRLALTGASSYAEAVAHGDLDGDGLEDAIVAHRTQLVSARQVGAGVLADPVVRATGTFFSAVDAADVDGDGDVDVLAADQDLDRLVLLRNAGGGVFLPPAFVPSCDGPVSLSLRDLDGDLDRDALVTCIVSDSVIVYTNDGTGAFSGGIGLGLGGNANPMDAVAGDLDGDGDRDLVVAAADSVIVLRRNATGPLVFSQVWSAGGCSAAESVALGDVNGDGRLDIAVNCRLGARVRFYLNAGSLAFTAGETPLVIQPLSVALADADGDGDLDLYALRGNDDTVVLHANDGAGHFTFRGAYTTDVDAWPMSVGDLDGDGDPDVLTAGLTSGTASVLLNTRVGCPASAALSVAGGSVAEGGAGTTALPFTVALSIATTWPVTVDYATSDGTATAADYAPASGTLTFAPGETQKTVAVAVNGDADPEPDETVVLLLSSASGAPVETEQASGTIVNDDGVAVVLTVDVGSVEGGSGAVTVAPPGATCANAPGAVEQCTYDLAPDALVTLTALASPDSGFLGWSGACSGTGACVVSMSEARQVSASFLGPRTLTVDVVSLEGGHGGVQVTPASLDGLVSCGDPSPGSLTCAFRYTPGTEVTVSAGAFIGSVFQQWGDACTGSGPCTVTPSGPGPGPRVVASFLGPRTLTVDVVSLEGGHGGVQVTPASLDGLVSCADPSPGSLTCAFRYTPGTEVTVSAGAFIGSVFQQWGDACTGSGPCTVTPSGPGSGPRVVASFLGPRTLTVDLVSLEGGHGGVQVTPASLDGLVSCGDPSPGSLTCAFRYTPGTEVTLSAGAFIGSVFQQWGDACTGSGPCTVTPSGPDPGPRVVASFLGPRTLTVDVVSLEGGHGGVQVTPASLDGLVSCADPSPGSLTCAFRYTPGTAVTLSTGAFVGSVFQQWGDACTGSGPCTVTPSGPDPGPRVVASFLGPRTLTASLVSVGGHGTLTVSPLAVSGGDSCVLPSGAPSATCVFAYAPDTAVTVTAVPAPGSVVSAMGGACPATGPCVVTMSAAATVTASFALANQPPVAHAGGPYAGLRGQAIGFDGSGSSDPDGQALTYLWTFSDGGTATGVSPTHAFAALGTHSASLVVSDGIAASPPSTATVTIANALPSVTLTAPGDGSTHPEAGPIALAADALDADGPVVRVAFYAGATLVGEAFAPPFTAAWSGAAAGTYVLTAQATDADGATTTSAPRTVHLNPGPTVALTAPANGTVFVAGATVSLTATAADDLGVVRVEFYAGAALVGTDTSSPYAFAWTGAPAGRHVLTARAVDTTGGSTISAPVTIDVATVLSAVADSHVRDNSGGNDNFGSATALETRTGSTGSNRWTYLRFDIGSVPSVQAARLRLFGNLATTTSVAVQARAFSSPNVSWSESSIVWNNKPVPDPAVLASVPLVTSSTTARWYEWDLTAFLQAEKAAGRTAVTIVLRNDVATSPHATFRSRQASSNRPELRVTP